MQFAKVLVTGGAGFVGSHLIDKLVEMGLEIVAIDNLTTGFRQNLEGSELSGKVEFIEKDVIDLDKISVPHVDLVYNLACAASPPRYQANPIHTIQTCIQGAINTARIADWNRARIVHTSTSEVYGDPEIHPQREDYRGAVNPIGPRACYDEGKRAAETILFDFKRRTKLNIGICRIFNTYGPRMDPYDGRVVSNFLRQALTGEPITIYGDGSQTRSFCYVDDLVDGLWRLGNASAEISGPINLGMPREITVLELAETICDLVGSKASLRFLELPTDDPQRRCPDISRARAQLGWEPRTPLLEGLARTMDYFDDVISSGRINAYRVARPTGVAALELL